MVNFQGIERLRRHARGGLVGLAAVLLAAAPGFAAPAGGKVTPPLHPWPQTISDLAADPAVRFGVLPNGMRYAIMRNTTPTAEVSIRFRIDAGAHQGAQRRKKSTDLHLRLSPLPPGRHAREDYDQGQEDHAGEEHEAQAVA